MPSKLTRNSERVVSLASREGFDRLSPHHRSSALSPPLAREAVFAGQPWCAQAEGRCAGRAAHRAPVDRQVHVCQRQRRCVARQAPGAGRSEKTSSLPSTLTARGGQVLTKVNKANETVDLQYAGGAGFVCRSLTHWDRVRGRRLRSRAPLTLRSTTKSGSASMASWKWCTATGGRREWAADSPRSKSTQKHLTEFIKAMRGLTAAENALAECWSSIFDTGSNMYNVYAKNVVYVGQMEAIRLQMEEDLKVRSGQQRTHEALTARSAIWTSRSTSSMSSSRRSKSATRCGGARTSIPPSPL